MPHPFLHTFSDMLMSEPACLAGSESGNPSGHEPFPAPGIAPGTVACRFNPAIQNFRSRVTQLLTLESHMVRAHSQSREALVHAGKMAVVGRMVASVNHEIRRPLTSMQLFMEHMRDLIVSDKREGMLETLELLEHATAQMVDLCHQLEASSRKMPLNRTRVPVRKAIEQAGATLSPKINTGGYDLHVQGGDHSAFADLDRLTLAIVNLLDNAMDATTGVTNKRIDIDVQEEGSEVVIRVRDHGPGIPAEVMERLFEAFFTTKPEGQGMGLGLALSSEVLAEMDGRLLVRNHPDGGAEFSIHLPIAGKPS